MSLDLQELALENERLSTQAGAGWMKNFVKLPEGNGHIVVRFLSTPDGMFDRAKNPFYQYTRIHRVNEKSLHCPRNLVNNKFVGECCICDYYNWLWRESEKKGPDEAARMQAKARAIKPIERYYFNCIVRSLVNEETQQIEKNVGPLILSVGKTLCQMIIRAIVGNEKLDEKGLGDVTHPLKGRDFKLIKTMRHSGKESYPNYSESKFLDPTPLGTPEEVEKWLAGCHDLVGLRVLPTADDLKHNLKVHLGLIRDNKGGFDPREWQTSEEAAGVTVTEDEIAEGAERAAFEANKRSTPSTPAPKPDAQVEAEKEGDKSQPMVESDFLAELRGM